MTEPTYLWIEPRLRAAMYQFRRKVVWFRWQVDLREPCVFRARDGFGALACDRPVHEARAAVFNAYGPLMTAFDEYVWQTVSDSRGKDAGTWVEPPDGGPSDYPRMEALTFEFTTSVDDAGHVTVTMRDASTE